MEYKWRDEPDAMWRPMLINSEWRWTSGHTGPDARIGQSCIDDVIIPCIANGSLIPIGPLVDEGL